MKSLPIWLILGACGLPACSWLAQPVPVPIAAPVPPRPTVLTEEAETALRAAEQSVSDARARRILWTTAVMQLELARAAAREFDSEATLRHAREAIALCELSVQQLSAPPVKW